MPEDDSILPLTTSVDVLLEARRVGIVGSRTYPELERVGRLVEQLHPEAIVVTGGAAGVDRAAEEAAIRQGRGCLTFRPRPGLPRDQYIAHLFERNMRIVRASDVIVAFHDGVSKGTADTIQKAKKMHGFCILVRPGCEPEVVG